MISDVIEMSNDPERRPGYDPRWTMTSSEESPGKRYVVICVQLCDLRGLRQNTNELEEFWNSVEKNMEKCCGPHLLKNTL